MFVSEELRSSEHPGLRGFETLAGPKLMQRRARFARARAPGLRGELSGGGISGGVWGVWGGENGGGQVLLCCFGGVSGKGAVSFFFMVAKTRDLV